MRIVTSRNAWIGYEYSLQNLNRPRANHKHDPSSEQWGVCNNLTKLALVSQPSTPVVTKDPSISHYLNSYLFANDYPAII